MGVGVPYQLSLLQDDQIERRVVETSHSKSQHRDVLARIHGAKYSTNCFSASMEFIDGDCPLFESLASRSIIVHKFIYFDIICAF